MATDMVNLPELNQPRSPDTDLTSYPPQTLPSQAEKTYSAQSLQSDTPLSAFDEASRSPMTSSFKQPSIQTEGQSPDFLSPKNTKVSLSCLPLYILLLRKRKLSIMAPQAFVRQEENAKLNGVAKEDYMQMWLWLSISECLQFHLVIDILLKGSQIFASRLSFLSWFKLFTFKKLKFHWKGRYFETLQGHQSFGLALAKLVDCCWYYFQADPSSLLTVLCITDSNSCPIPSNQNGKGRKEGRVGGEACLLSLKWLKSQKHPGLMNSILRPKSKLLFDLIYWSNSSMDIILTVQAKSGKKSRGVRFQTDDGDIVVPEKVNHLERRSTRSKASDALDYLLEGNKRFREVSFVYGLISRHYKE